MRRLEISVLGKNIDKKLSLELRMKISRKS